MPKIEFDSANNKIIISETLEEAKARILKKIQEAKDLGDTEEVSRLQKAWQEKKQSK